MTTGVDEFDNRIRDLVVQEKECDCLFEEVKNGNGEKSFPYLTLRDSCNKLRREIFRNAKLAGLTRERVTKEIKEVRSQPAISREAK